jgi:hypothetical protein
MNRITYTDLTVDQLDHIWANLRALDRVELEVAGFDDSNYRSILSPSRFMMCGLLDCEPAAAFGHESNGYCLYFFFFGIDAVDRFPVTMTRMARAYIDARCEEYPHLLPLIGVHDQHHVSRRWLKRLGFVESGAYCDAPKGRLLLVERDR